MSRLAALITLNDVESPQTGGDAVYQRIHIVLKERYSDVQVHALPGGSKPIRYLECLAASLALSRENRLVFTSSCPSFPVFGDATYHQPKGGSFTHYTRGERLDRRLACILTEHEALSPLWLLAKKRIRLHLANSEYTRRTVKRLYGVESRVLYPPVEAPPRIQRQRRHLILVTKPERVSGVEELPRALSHAPRGAEAAIIGRIDDAGRQALKALRERGIAHRYHGYVTEEEKHSLMEEAGVHLNLVVNESFGLSTVEAMSHGCIPVAHRSGAPPEYLPGSLLYGEAEEAGEIIAQHMDAGEEAREEQRRIAARFSAERFRRELHSHLAELDREAKF